MSNLADLAFQLSDERSCRHDAVSALASLNTYFVLNLPSEVLFG
jgi:hypothetical protein